MRNLGGAIGLAVANTLMIQLTKQHYAILREAVTAGAPQAHQLLFGLQKHLAKTSVPDEGMAALKQVYGLVLREAEVLTLNSLFHMLSLIFLFALLLMPWVSKVSADAAEGAGH